MDILKRAASSISQDNTDGTESMNISKILWQQKLYPIVKKEALSIDMDPQELVRELTKYLSSYM